MSNGFERKQTWVLENNAYTALIMLIEEKSL